MNLRVSITVPTYNDAEHLGMCLASLVLQTYSNWECIVVDDGSDIPLGDIVESFRDSRFRYIRLERNLGRGAARNRALEECRGEFVALQDADDWSMPLRLEVQLKQLAEHPEVDFLSTGMLTSNDDGEDQGVCRDSLCPARHVKPLERPFIGHATLMFRRRVLDDFRYREEFKISEDIDFLQRALRKHKYMNIPDCLYFYREAQSQSLRKYSLSTLARYKILKENFTAQPASASLLGIRYALSFVLYFVAFATGKKELLLNRHWRKPSESQCFAMEEARNSILEFTGKGRAMKRALGGP